MSHDELLAKIDEEGEFLVQHFDSKPIVHSALRAVVELHKPIDAAEGFSQASRDILGYTNVCDECLYDGGPYPCNTIQAIEKELG